MRHTHRGRSRLAPLAPLLGLALLAACTTAGGNARATPTPEATPEGNAAAPPPAPPLRAPSILTLELQGLQPLAAGHYEGWALLGAERVSTGKFAVAEDGALRSLAGTPIEAFAVGRDIASAGQLTITIEPEGDADAAPSSTVVLQGTVQTGRALLAFPVPTNALAGGYVLATPTDDATDNETAGVWFLNPSGPAPALTLPELPAGWAYEGWAATQRVALSTGRFARASGADSAAPYSGPRPGPAFPGEDFLTRLPEGVRTPVNLADGASFIAISVEPDLNGQDPTGPAPFWLVPLRGQVPVALPPNTLRPLEVDPAVVPSGVATLG